MAGDLYNILRPNVFTKVITQQMAAASTWLNFFGFQPGGKNEENWGHGRTGAYTVFNHTRKIAQGRAAGTAAGKANMQDVSLVPFTYPRMHEEISLPAEMLHNIGQIDNPTVRDAAATKMISKQMQYAAEKAANWRLALLYGMIRGQLYITQSGDTWYPTTSSSGAAYTISFGLPAGNKSQLDMLNGGSLVGTAWDNPAAPIIQDPYQINAAFQQLYGGYLETIVISSVMWYYIINNTEVKGVAGSANTCFMDDKLEVGTNADGSPKYVIFKRLKAAPEFQFIVTDDVVQLGAPGSESYVKLVGDTDALFLPSMSQGYFGGYIGSEPIAEYNNGPKSVKFGYSAWNTETANPTSTNIFQLDNFLPVPHIPNCYAYGTVDFG